MIILQVNFQVLNNVAKDAMRIQTDWPYKVSITPLVDLHNFHNLSKMLTGTPRGASSAELGVHCLSDMPANLARIHAWIDLRHECT